jgi:feruloyl esterase
VRVFTPTSHDSGVSSEIWLPDAIAWNGKLLATCNGGYSSALSYRQMAEALQRGFAVAGSDTGHEGDGLAFLLRFISVSEGILGLL